MNLAWRAIEVYHGMIRDTREEERVDGQALSHLGQSATDACEACLADTQLIHRNPVSADGR